MSIEDDIRRVVREELQPVISRLETALQRLEASTSSPAGVLTVEEVAQRAGNVTPETVRRWIDSKQLRARRAGHRWVVRPEDLEAYLSRSGGESETLSADQHMQLVAKRIARAAGGRR